jgi:3-hydroxy-D-aspartate aldolase
MSEAKPGLGPNQAFIGVKGSRGKLNTPALLLDLDALEGYFAAMAAHTRAAGINLWPHSKGAKSIEIGRRQMATGAVGICCRTIGEAEVIAGSGIGGCTSSHRSRNC